MKVTKSMTEKITEEEAKEKWCPYNIETIGKVGSRCQASDCMAWRWFSARKDQGFCNLIGQ